MKLYGKDFDKRELLERVGDISQIGGACPATLRGGRKEGVDVINVKTGSGLAFTIVPSRCLDISNMSYKGIPISFISKTGMSAPEYYETDYDGFHRSFFAGMLTTCGLRNTGAGNMDNGEYFGLHGRISNTPAENVCVNQEWLGNEFRIKIRGSMRESKLYGENLLLERTIETKLGANTVSITDTLTNEGFRSEGVMILYHCNFGFPFLDRSTRIWFSEGTVIPRDSTAAEALSGCAEAEDPQTDFPETVFFHDIKPDRDGYASAVIFNTELPEGGFGVKIRYKKDTLPYLIQWKNMMKGDYVMALEPSNSYPIGRKETKENHMLQVLGAGESVTYQVELQILDSVNGIMQSGVL